MYDDHPKAVVQRGSRYLLHWLRGSCQQGTGQDNRSEENVKKGVRRPPESSSGIHMRSYRSAPIIKLPERDSPSERHNVVVDDAPAQ